MNNKKTMKQGKINKLQKDALFLHLYHMGYSEFEIKKKIRSK